MKKPRFKLRLRQRSKYLYVLIAAGLGLAGLLLYRLGSLTGGLSAIEVQTAQGVYGLHGLYHQPLYLPLNFIRSIDFFVFSNHGQTLTRLPNVIFGALTIISFAWLVRLWHGNRTAIFATLLFACGAWTLHVSRLASYDVLYLWAVPTLLASNALLNRQPLKAKWFYGAMLLWGLLLYIPGLVWLVAINMFWQRGSIKQGWQQFKTWWQRLLYVLAGLIWLPLLINGLLHEVSLKIWLGLPDHLSKPTTLLRQFIDVPYHLFVRGPLEPQLWLARAPILDVFTLVTCILGLYFYALNSSARRSRVLGSFLIVGAVLVGLGGPVGLSVIVPILYLVAATGIAFLVREWLKVFPINPLARGLGIGLIVVAIVLSCTYNVRAYFVAWPHNSVTVVSFRYHR